MGAELVYLSLLEDEESARHHWLGMRGMSTGRKKRFDVNKTYLGMYVRKQRYLLYTRVCNMNICKSCVSSIQTFVAFSGAVFVFDFEPWSCFWRLWPCDLAHCGKNGWTKLVEKNWLNKIGWTKWLNKIVEQNSWNVGWTKRLTIPHHITLQVRFISVMCIRIPTELYFGKRVKRGSITLCRALFIHVYV